MALTAQEQEILDFALAALPPWYKEELRELEFDGACAKIMRDAQRSIEYWVSQTYILEATGANAVDPDWLQGHALDRGTARQGGETDTVLRARLRNPSDALNRDSLLTEIQAIVDAEDPTRGPIGLVELRLNCAFMLDELVEDTQAADTGDWTEPDSDGNQVFTPGTAPLRLPYRPNYEERAYQITISGATDANNDGTFDIIGISGNGVIFENPSGSEESSAGPLTWTIVERGPDGRQISGFADSYFDVGDRFCDQSYTLVVILPFGSDATTEAAVREILRQKKAGGVLAIIETRLVP